MHPGGRRFHSGSWVSLRCALVSSGSFVVFRFTRVPPGCSSVHSGSLDSPGFALGVVGIILGRWCAPCWLTG